jgi:hypothetical protein
LEEIDRIEKEYQAENGQEKLITPTALSPLFLRIKAWCSVGKRVEDASEPIETRLEKIENLVKAIGAQIFKDNTTKPRSYAEIANMRNAATAQASRAHAPIEAHRETHQRSRRILVRINSPEEIITCIQQGNGEAHATRKIIATKWQYPTSHERPGRQNSPKTGR